MTAPKFSPPKTTAQLLLDDYQQLLTTASGRRLAYHLTRGLGRLEAESFDAAIKDGLCAALHQARADGIREMARVIDSNLRKADKGAYALMITEGITASFIEDAKGD